MLLTLKLFHLHNTNLLTTPTAAAPAPLSQSPSPTDDTDRRLIHPNATRVISQRAGVLSQPINSPRSRPSSSTSSPPPSRRRRLNETESPKYSLQSVPGNALDVYTTVMDKVNDTSNSVRQILKDQKISEKTFYRKKKIAELMILDIEKFDTVVKQMVREEKMDRLNQQMLSDKCGTILKTADFLLLKRNAIASGQLI